MPLELAIVGLAIERGGRVLFSDLSVRVAAGEAVALTGPNGAGKTTLLRALAGFCRPLAGRVRLLDGPRESDVGENCHFVGHANGVKPALTVGENAEFWANYLGGRRDGIAAALDRFALADLSHIPAAYLSAGQKRRLALARLLLAERPVWLLDEPTVSLDAASTGMLAGVVNAHVKGGGIVVAATHVPLGLTAARELRLGTTAGVSDILSDTLATTLPTVSFPTVSDPRSDTSPSPGAGS